jgi:hypothetical protein
MGYKTFSLDCVSVWDLPAADVINSMDFGLTFGDGLTLHTVATVLDEVINGSEYVEGADELINALDDLLAEKGPNFYLSF